MDKYITLNNGVKMPVVGFGTVGIKGEEGVQSIIDAVNCGYRFIDTAHMYGNQREVGEAVRKCGLPREELFITTKLNRNFSDYESAKEGIRQSLEVMGLDYIDLYLIHEPYEKYRDMYRALEEFYRAGKIRAIGISNFDRVKYDNLLQCAKIVPAVNQIESHVYYPHLDLKEYLSSKGTATQAWAPFAGGNADIAGNGILKKIAAAHGKTPHQVALRYLVENGIAVLPKSHSRARIRQNIDIFDFSLTDREKAEIATIDTGKTSYPWTEDWDKLTY